MGKSSGEKNNGKRILELEVGLSFESVSLSSPGKVVDSLLQMEIVNNSFNLKTFKEFKP